MKTMMQALEDDRMEKERLDNLVPDAIHDRIMKDLQKEWLGDNLHRHQDQRRMIEGIRSSQISALVMYLIQKGVLK